MTEQPPIWPESQLQLAFAQDWISSRTNTTAPTPHVLQVKRWGVTARFGSAVLKVSFVPLFPQVQQVHAAISATLPDAAPRLIAHEMRDGKLWTLFEHVEGPTVEEVATTAALSSTAFRLGELQAAVAQTDCPSVPRIDVTTIARLLLDDIQDQPPELAEWLRGALPQFDSFATELSTVPYSLDHPDVNSSNAIVCQTDGRVVLLDWEEATQGCPLFSLDRLLEDAEEADCVEDVKKYYLQSFGRASERQLTIALCLSPLKLAIEARSFARSLGFAHPHTKLTNIYLLKSKERCAALE